MNLGILILHYNTPELTSDLCRMVGPDAIVIDNGSNKEKEYHGSNRCIRLPENYGFTKGWNVAIKRLWDEFDAFWLMNSDIIIGKKCLSRIRGLMDTGNFHILTPSYNCWIKQCQNHGTMMLREVKCIELTAPVITKEAFEKIGMFDQLFSLGSGVDFDFCLRAQRTGIKIWCDDGSSFEHLQHRTIDTVTHLKEYSQRANLEMNLGMARKYGIKWKIKIREKLNINKSINMNQKKVAVYTTIFGQYDTLHAVPKQIMQADYFCITDDAEYVKKTMETAPNSEKWEIVQVEVPRKDLHPRMRAKWYKLFPWDLDQLRDYDITIFFDGCVVVTSPEWISHCVQNLKSDMLMFRHPYRDCIYDELKASEIMVKYKNEPITKQIDYYRRFHPAKSGLYACTVMVRRKSARLNALMMSWFYENIKFTWQDQLSFPVVCRVHNFRPDLFQENLYKNQFFKVVSHADKADQELLAGKPEEKTGNPMTRNDVMNFIIEKMGYKTYLEIGLRGGYTFQAIKLESKESVDPVAINGLEPTWKMKSDDFFATVAIEKVKKYDMIFIDGDHEREQVFRDLMNSAQFLNENGCIVMHDTNPPDERFTKEDRCFNAFMALIDLAINSQQLQVYTLTIPEDEGNGISMLFKGKKTTKLPDEVTMDDLTLRQYATFDKYRRELSNPVTFDELSKIILQKSKVKTKAVKK